jgi:hypothetical protein
MSDVIILYIIKLTIKYNIKYKNKSLYYNIFSSPRKACIILSLTCNMYISVFYHNKDSGVQFGESYL